MLKMLDRLMGEDIQLTWRPKANLWTVRMDASQIDQILVNLCVNARDAIAGVGLIHIKTENRVLDEQSCAMYEGFTPGDYVLLAVSDTGCGMDKDTVSHIFEPFFTTGKNGKGTGLGLATIYGIVRQNNGLITVESEPGKGTTFSVYLPRYTGKAEEEQIVPEAKSVSLGRQTVLLVEDEPAVLKLVKKMLERLDITVLAASTPGEAIRLTRDHAGDIHLLMTDIILPEMSGSDLAKSILSFHPCLKCLFMSGYTAEIIAHRSELDKDAYFIQKPFSIDELTAKVRQVLDS
jgi:CheY-like chemotaxis protein